MYEWVSYKWSKAIKSSEQLIEDNYSLLNIVNRLHLMAAKLQLKLAIIRYFLGWDRTRIKNSIPIQDFVPVSLPWKFEDI